MRILVGVLAFCLVGLFDLALICFGAKIFLWIAEWYNITFLLELGLGQVVGIFLIIGLLNFKQRSKEEKEKDLETSIAESFSKLFDRLIYFLSVLLVSWAYFKILC